MNDQGFSFSPCHIRNYTANSPTASLCAGKIFRMTPCQNPHFILASFMLSCCLLETSLITAGVQDKVYFRTLKQLFRAVTITETGVPLPLPTWAEDKLQVLLMTGAGKKSFDLHYSLCQSAWAVAVRATSVTDWLSDSSTWLTVTSASLQRSCLTWVSSECPSGVHTPTVWARSSGVVRETPACNLTWPLRRHWGCSICKGWKEDAS